MEPILSINSTRKLLWFKLQKNAHSSLRVTFIVPFITTFGTRSGNFRNLGCVMFPLTSSLACLIYLSTILTSVGKVILYVTNCSNQKQFFDSKCIKRLATGICPDLTMALAVCSAHSWIQGSCFVPGKGRTGKGHALVMLHAYASVAILRTCL